MINAHYLNKIVTFLEKNKIINKHLKWQVLYHKFSLECVYNIQIKNPRNKQKWKTIIKESNNTLAHISNNIKIGKTYCIDINYKESLILFRMLKFDIYKINNKIYIGINNKCSKGI